MKTIFKAKETPDGEWDTESANKRRVLEVRTLGDGRSEVTAWVGSSGESVSVTKLVELVHEHKKRLRKERREPDFGDES